MWRMDIVSSYKRTVQSHSRVYLRRREEKTSCSFLQTWQQRIEKVTGIARLVVSFPVLLNFCASAVFGFCRHYKTNKTKTCYGMSAAFVSVLSRKTIPLIFNRVGFVFPLKPGFHLIVARIVLIAPNLLRRSGLSNGNIPGRSRRSRSPGSSAVLSGRSKQLKNDCKRSNGNICRAIETIETIQIHSRFNMAATT